MTAFELWVIVSLTLVGIAPAVVAGGKGLASLLGLGAVGTGAGVGAAGAAGAFSGGGGGSGTPQFYGPDGQTLEIDPRSGMTQQRIEEAFQMQQPTGLPEPYQVDTVWKVTVNGTEIPYLDATTGLPWWQAQAIAAAGGIGAVQSSLLFEDGALQRLVDRAFPQTQTPTEIQQDVFGQVEQQPGVGAEGEPTFSADVFGELPPLDVGPGGNFNFGNPFGGGIALIPSGTPTPETGPPTFAGQQPPVPPPTDPILPPPSIFTNPGFDVTGFGTPIPSEPPTITSTFPEITPPGGSPLPPGVVIPPQPPGITSTFPEITPPVGTPPPVAGGGSSQTPPQQQPGVNPLAFLQGAAGFGAPDPGQFAPVVGQPQPEDEQTSLRRLMPPKQQQLMQLLQLIGGF